MKMSIVAAIYLRGSAADVRKLFKKFKSLKEYK